MDGTKTPRVRRTKANIVACIQQAAEDEIKENGFSSSLVTGIIRRAKIEPQVFYNRYKDLGDFYDSFVKKYDNWLDDVLDNVKSSIVTESGLTQMFEELITAVNSDPVFLEVIRWEIADKNKTTTRTSGLRQRRANSIVEACDIKFRNSATDITALLALLSGGIYFLSLRSKLAPFYGIDTQQPESRQRISDTVSLVVNSVYDKLRAEQREEEIIMRLRRSGVSEDVIAAAFAR